MNSIKKRDEMFSKPALKERGWTDSLIKKFLPTHDGERLNPHYRCAPPMKLYRIERVKKIENSKEFVEMIEKSKKRKETARQAVDNKISNIMEYAQNIDIVIPIIPDNELKYRACADYNDFKEYQSAIRGEPLEYSPAGPYSDDVFLARICTNYLRHNCTDYETHLEKLFGRTGVHLAHDIIKKRINDKISEQYPWIKDAMATANKKSDRLHRLS